MHVVFDAGVNVTFVATIASIGPVEVAVAAPPVPVVPEVTPVEGMEVAVPPAPVPEKLVAVSLQALGTTSSAVSATLRMEACPNGAVEHCAMENTSRSER